MTTTNATAKVVTILGQVALGWLLTAQDFGLYAIVLSLATAAGALRHGGVVPLLIQRGAEYDQLAPLLFKVALIFNMLALIILAALAALSLLVFDGDIAAMVGIVALSFPVSTVAMLWRAKLAIDRRFRMVATLTMTSSIIWQVSLVSLAFYGFGPFSFAIGFLIQALFEGLVGRSHLKKLRLDQAQISWCNVKPILRETRWIMLTSAMLGLATAGDYLAVGLLKDSATVGFYFFAFQLVVAVGVLFNHGVEGIFPSLLAQLEGNRDRQLDAFIKVLRLVMLASIPTSALLILGAPSIVHFVWQGRWDTAIFAVQILSICIPAWLVVNTGRTLLEARGLWRSKFWLVAAYGGGGISAAVIGALLGDLSEIAIAVTVYYVLYAICFLALLSALTGLSAPSAYQVVLGPALLTISAVLTSMAAGRSTLNATDPYFAPIAEVFLFIFVVLLGNAVLFRGAWAEVLATLRRRGGMTRG